jgi:hypothetical protein
MNDLRSMSTQWLVFIEQKAPGNSFWYSLLPFPSSCILCYFPLPILVPPLACDCKQGPTIILNLPALPELLMILKESWLHTLSPEFPVTLWVTICKTGLDNDIISIHSQQMAWKWSTVCMYNPTFCLSEKKKCLFPCHDPHWILPEYRIKVTVITVVISCSVM